MSSSGKSGGQTTPLVATVAGGVALVNGTPTIVTLTTPNDGKVHQYFASLVKSVTVAETGGAVQLKFTGLGVALTASLDAGGEGIGTLTGQRSIVADPNTVVQIQQVTALTLGASTVIAAISGG